MLTVIPVDSVEEAITVANDSCYGLASAVWTDDLTTPFGGFKESGIGRDKSRHALEKYVELKTTWISLAERSWPPASGSDLATAASMILRCLSRRFQPHLKGVREPYIKATIRDPDCRAHAKDSQGRGIGTAVHHVRGSHTPMQHLPLSLRRA